MTDLYNAGVGGPAWRAQQRRRGMTQDTRDEGRTERRWFREYTDSRLVESLYEWHDQSEAPDEVRSYLQEIADWLRAEPSGDVGEEGDIRAIVHELDLHEADLQADRVFGRVGDDQAADPERRARRILARLRRTRDSGGTCGATMDGCPCNRPANHAGLHHDGLVYWGDEDSDATQDPNAGGERMSDRDGGRTERCAECDTIPRSECCIPEAPHGAGDLENYRRAEPSGDVGEDAEWLEGLIEYHASQAGALMQATASPAQVEKHLKASRVLKRILARLRRTPETEALHKWSDNVPVSMVGAALRHAQNQPAGDNIDRGLALIEALRIKGFEIRALATQDPNAGGEDD